VVEIMASENALGSVKTLAMIADGRRPRMGGQAGRIAKGSFG
jgi:hypothetical protein